jgi:hypothetical protein
MLARNDNGFTSPREVTVTTFLRHAWEKQEQRQLNIRGRPVWVPSAIGAIFDQIRRKDCELAKDFILKYKDAWRFLKHWQFKSKEEQERDLKSCAWPGTMVLHWGNAMYGVGPYFQKEPDIPTMDYDFGSVRGRDFELKFSLSLVNFEPGKFGLISFTEIYHGQ